jgi:hypothetical protein
LSAELNVLSPSRLILFDYSALSTQHSALSTQHSAHLLTTDL